MKELRWHPFTIGMWNPGERPELRETLMWAMSHFELDVFALIEMADQIKRVLLPLEAQGFGLLLGPDGKADARKLAQLYNPASVKVLEPLAWKTDDAFEGRRRGHPVRMGNRWKIGAEYLHHASGRTPIVLGGHEVPTQSNPEHRAHARKSITRTAANMRDTRGALFVGADWNNTPKTSQYAPIRGLYSAAPVPFLDDVKAFGSEPTFRDGRNIDRWVWRDREDVQVTGVQRVDMPGKEKGPGGQGHRMIVLRCALASRD